MFSKGQIQLASITQENQALDNIPRVSWSLPIATSLSRESSVLGAYGGLTLKNGGVIYDYEGDRYKKRAISIGPEIGVLLGNSFFLMAAVGFDYNLHYKEKIFPNQKRSEKQVVLREWWSNRVTKFNPHAKVGLGMREGLYVYVDYYFSEFLNQDFTETINGVEIKPYHNLQANRFNIGIGFMIN